ncbi:hypothetical protein [Kitasatospora sp. NPDC004531]
MTTSIHGAIEHRHPGVDAGYLDTDDAEPWIAAIDLWPLYDRTDYAAFGLLFGVRNLAGVRPLAAGRGLPPDVSSELRARLEFLDDATWVGWTELAGLDPQAVDGVLGGGTHWPHVFAVMKALADRYGQEAVRLVVAFD